MGGDQDDLLAFGQQSDRLTPVDSGIFDLIDQDDGGITHICGVGNHQGSGLPTAELSYLSIGGKFLPGQLIGALEALLHRLTQVRG